MPVRGGNVQRSQPFEIEFIAKSGDEGFRRLAIAERGEKGFGITRELRPGACEMVDTEPVYRYGPRFERLECHVVPFPLRILDVSPV
jgi:hypothetical protein